MRAHAHIACVPADAVAITEINGVLPSGIYVGGAGTVAVIDAAGTTCNYTAVAGSIIPIMPAFVKSTGTTATLMVLLYDR